MPTPLFQPSTLYQSWVSRLRIPMLAGSKMWQGFAGMVDKAVDWSRQAVVEGLPSYASEPAIALHGSERLLERGPSEPIEAYADRLTNAVQQWKLAGTPLGLLLALYFAGHRDVVVVQQNGRAFQLQGVDLTPDGLLNDILVTECSTLITGLHSTVDLSKTIPTGRAWWTFDGDTDRCSRFALLISVRKIARVTFDGTEDGSLAHPWPTAAWGSSFPSTDYRVLVGLPVVTDAGGGIVILGPLVNTQTVSGVQIASSHPFEGYVDIFAYGPTGNPLSDPTLIADSIPVISAIADKWRPARAGKEGAHAIVAGKYFGWPVRTFGSGGLFGPGSVLHYDI